MQNALKVVISGNVWSLKTNYISAEARNAITSLGDQVRQFAPSP